MDKDDLSALRELAHGIEVELEKSSEFSPLENMKRMISRNLIQMIYR